MSFSVPVEPVRTAHFAYKLGNGLLVPWLFSPALCLTSKKTFVRLEVDLYLSQQQQLLENNEVKQEDDEGIENEVKEEE